MPIESAEEGVELQAEIDAGAQEGSVLKGLKQPYEPSPQEVSEHRISHTPYRAWCRDCVAGRGKAAAHYK
eukprot:1317258-Amphidinium_carterae.1